ncbi:hypothetical protein BIFGAL_03445 [Bifidobacterium gallicum DSM 20093 = LMG 11596]|uniref:Uncharacterized protein n=1 Tax=Bifidobacterium gallicum DSM 20093 = LMG 11596 TaxID=561180 RepID=D1NUC4_9BIFI|nr:hypothetical protein BIFGAL_03445 [Bifidobacterium gallicum DSM 20093 = LMG 11596]
MRFLSGKCGFADQLGQERCALEAESAVFLTTLVRGDAVLGGKVQFF